MTRLILSSLAVAAVLSMAASGFALSEDFSVWRKQFGTSAAKKHDGAVNRKETITIHGSPGAASKHKGEIEVQSFGGDPNPSPGWPSKIDWGGLKGASDPSPPKSGVPPGPSETCRRRRHAMPRLIVRSLVPPREIEAVAKSSQLQAK